MVLNITMKNNKALYVKGDYSPSNARDILTNRLSTVYRNSRVNAPCTTCCYDLEYCQPKIIKF